MSSSIFDQLSRCGISKASSFHEKRNLRLTNQISLMLIGAIASVIVYRLFIGSFNWIVGTTLVLQIPLYALPIVFNRLGHTTISRVLVCWLPPVASVAAAVTSFSILRIYESSTYASFQFFLIAFGCFPFLVFKLSEWRPIVLCLSAPALAILLYNPILNFYEVGYWQMGLHDSGYSFNTFRAFISLVVINLAIFQLKLIIEKNDRLNSCLMIELKEKNKMILERAVVEVTELDEKLYANLHLLKKSEANLHAIINNTDRFIWSVDGNLQLIAYNKSFFNHVKRHYGIEVKKGENVLRGLERDEKEMATKWSHYYSQAFQGQTVCFEETRFGVDFHHSLNPIIEEDGSVSGANVFSSDITDQKIRARELAEANKKIGELRLAALRAAMNPHFIFNALNSIQSFIVKNDRLNAVSYLSTFSKLIRGILNHSVSNVVRLTEELELLKNYVQLEMVRFESKFDFTLSIDPDIDVDNIEIPPLLIQPYVENAILHGLWNKQDTGALNIRVRETKNGVLFEIEDDGIGRAAAMKLNRQKISLHKSMGVKLTEERLKLINESHQVTFNVQDLEQEGRACGTKVSIVVGLN